MMVVAIKGVGVVQDLQLPQKNGICTPTSAIYVQLGLLKYVTFDT